MAKPHKNICITMYTDDLRRLDRRVAQAKSNGHTSMSRSKMIRLALDALEKVGLPPKEE